MDSAAIKAELENVLRALKESMLFALEQEVASRGASDEDDDGNVFVKRAEAGQKYQDAYTRALGLVRSLMPDRYAEFVGCYEPDPKRKDMDAHTYAIKDFWLGLTVTRRGEEVFSASTAAFTRIQHQEQLVRSLLNTLGTRIADAKSVLQADLFRRELEAADELHKKGHLRAAGAVAGVVIESHLATVATVKAIKVAKKNPTIADLNDPLKEAAVYDVPMWRLIQRLADIRNLCVHKKDRDPTKDEVRDLIIGAAKCVAEIG